MPLPMPCSDEMFVVAWEKAETLDEAARLAGYTGPSAKKVTSARAGRLRSLGVRLAPFRRGNGGGHVGGKTRVSKLNWMAEKARGASCAESV